FFVNLLPLRANLRDGLPFRELQRQVREATLAAWSHQEMPFDELVRDLRPVRDPARSPLFQVVFAWQETPDWNLELPGVATEILPPPTVPARYDLSLTVVRREDRLDLHLAYDADLFEGSTAETLLRRWSSLLRAIRQRPDDTIDLLEAGDLEDLFLLRGPAAPDPARCVHHLFEEQAAKTPEAEAVAFGDLRFSYSALALRARTLAHRLRRLGVGPEVRVGLCCQPGPAAVIGILGILGAGGAWVPVDPNGPAERQLFFLADSGAQALVMEPAFAGRLAAFAGPRLVVDPREDPETDPGPFQSGAQPENLAYVLYTSGSTGTPKGVGVEHRQLAAYLAFVGRVLFAGRVRSCPFLTPPTFDACLKQVLAPLLRGDTVWGIEAGAGLDVRALLAELERREQVALNCTPTLWRAILEEVERRGSVPGLSRILLGGERLSPELFARTVAALPQAEVWNLYGPTETTANATAGRLRPGGPVVLGEPIDGAWICLLDRRMQPVPRGMPGEICVGGTGVARGYLGELSRPELTAERFVPDSSGTRLYRTGDLGRLTPDGELHFLGRTDRQVKLRGIRIELGEIEARLERHPLVREAAVAAKADRLTAYVVPMPSGIDTADLRSALMRGLPDSMVPAEIVALDRLPRLASGKVDHAALLGSGTAISSNRAFAAPRTATERQLADIWEEMLERKSVGIHDNFFELGGHSLQSIRISHRAAAAGLAISPRDLLQHPTIAELAALVQTSSPPALPGDLAIFPEPGRRHEPFPLSEIQQAYLVGRSELFELGGVGPTSYLEAEWPGLDVPRLENAWRRLVERHDMLRAVALPEGSWQILAEVTPYEIGLVDLRGLEPEAAHTALTLLREEMSSRLFLPGRWPLFDLKVTVREGSRVRLHVARDLLVGDVRSSEILLEELMHLYREPVAELPPLELSIRDYALAVDALHDRDAGRQARAYWQARLADLPPAPDLPLS
ncbi:MAG TPA: amino acid adenylation domain-containing protein, partial [Thermoanaerobaculia bacterium]|nr:amino acid adenylation domain-containing protein [Thermoanaerobaculia bacterium]